MSDRRAPIPRTDPEEGGNGDHSRPGEADDPLGYLALRASVDAQRVSIDALARTRSEDRLSFQNAVVRVRNDLGAEMIERFARSDAQRAVDVAELHGRLSLQDQKLSEILLHLHDQEQDRAHDRRAIEEAKRAREVAEATAALAKQRLEELADITAQFPRFEDPRASQNNEDAEIVREAARKLVGVSTNREETETKTRAADRRQFRRSMAASLVSGGILFTLVLLAFQQCGVIRTPAPPSSAPAAPAFTPPEGPP